MEQDPDITYSRFNKRFFQFPLDSLGNFQVSLETVYYFILFYFFIELYLPMGLFWGSRFDPVSRAGLL